MTAGTSTTITTGTRRIITRMSWSGVRCVITNDIQFRGVMSTKIEWVRNADGSTGKTWNPLAGCKEISPGCTNCYAAVMAKRLEAMGQEKYQGTTKTLANGKVVWTGKISLLDDDDDQFTEPLRRRKPTMYFVNSMSDLFHKDVPFQFVDQVFGVMSASVQHTFQVLTKRPERMAEYFRGGRPALSNVWLGTSVEDQQRANERIPWLLTIPAAVHFLSCEPLLGPVVFKEEWLPHKFSREPGCEHCETCVGRLNWLDVREANHGPFLEWVIVGGESGHRSRPMHPHWVRQIRKQCVKSKVPFFFKQWGEWVDLSQSALCSAARDKGHNPGFCRIDAEGQPNPGSDTVLYQFGKSKTGRHLDGVVWDQMPEVK